jgi:hypothetical protein
MNGVQMIERQIEPLSLLEIVRKERKLIKGVRDLGLTGPEAIKLLSHNEISTVKAENEPQRFDWRDEIEGGKVIIWMNDIEKDKRYEGWPKSLSAVSDAPLYGIKTTKICTVAPAHISRAATHRQKRLLLLGFAGRFYGSG